MKRRKKRKIVNLIPISPVSKEIFNTDMDMLHGGYVIEENGEYYRVKTINRACEFWIHKNNDLNWRVLK